MGRRLAGLALARPRGFGRLLAVSGLGPEQLPAGQPGAGCRGVLGPAVKIALALELSHVAQRLADRGGLYPLRSHRHGQAPAQRDDRLDQLVADPLVGELGDEAAIDLEAVERQGAQLREAGVTGTEIVEADANALVLETGHDRANRGDVLVQAILGHLDLEAMRRKAAVEQQL